LDATPPVGILDAKRDDQQLNQGARMLNRGPGLKLFSTAPQSIDHRSDEYLRKIADVASWSEACGCEGILIYTDNRILDPWLVSQVVVENSERLAPLIAVQPAYMHPYTAAKMVTSIGFLYQRRVYLNMVAGGFTNDLAGLGDTTPHDRRYERLVEYTSIIQSLLASTNPLTCQGEFYNVTNLRLHPPLEPDLMPGIMVSGSSEAGRRAAEAMGAVAIEYPKPPSETISPVGRHIECGIRIGIVAREKSAEAWHAARARFPEDRKGQIKHQLAMASSDSVWHGQLSSIVKDDIPENPYWLVPFQNSKTFCPYLVGSYESVAVEIERYVSLGYTTFILDIPPDKEELSAIQFVFELAQGGVRQ
jgi:alkanesulfonate monooxygenase